MFRPLKPGGEIAAKSVRGFLHHSKDATLAFSARLAINKKLGGIGAMTELSVDTKAKRIRLRLELIGEKEPIDLEITRYTLKTEGKAVHLVIEEVKASREWLEAALREYVVGQSLALPAKVAALLKLLA